MAKNTKPKYTGVLKEPIRLPKPDQASSPEELAAQLDQQFMDRVAALYDRYGLKFGQPGAHILLALGLAADHVPGFRVTDRGPGAPRKWMGDGGRNLYLEVQAITQRGKTVNNALTLLTEPGKPYENEDPKSLRSRYYEVCRDDPHVRFLEKLRIDTKRKDEWIERAGAALSTDTGPK